jgi:hypothetical protein
MHREGFHPTLVVETSPSNFQAWLKHPEQLDKQLSTATARTLAERFGGDTGAADWRHFGRLSGFANRKPKYQDVTTGLYPLVRLIEAEGKVYPQADHFLASVRRSVEERLRARERLRLQTITPPIGWQRKTIDSFRSDPRYAGDGNRIDLAYAVYALSHGATEEEVAAAIRTRDLSKKGAQHRQQDYVERTIRKAGTCLLEPSREIKSRRSSGSIPGDRAVGKPVRPEPGAPPISFFFAMPGYWVSVGARPAPNAGFHLARTISDAR